MGPRYVAYVDVHRRAALRWIESAHRAPALAVDERIDEHIRARCRRIVDLALAERSEDEAGADGRDVDVGVLLDEVVHGEVRERFGDEVYVDGGCAWLERVFPRKKAACCCCTRKFRDLM